jgi:uncharacterized protein with PQ loop repeat
MIVTILGWLAAGFSIAFLVPQIIKVLVNKRARDLSLIANCITFVGGASWGIYGILSHNPQVEATNFTVSLMAVILIVYQAMWIAKNKAEWNVYKNMKKINQLNVTELKQAIKAAKEELNHDGK